MNNWDEIDKYLLGRLSLKGRKDLESQIRKDPALAQQIRDRHLYIMAVEKHSFEHLKGSFREIEEDLDKEHFFLSDETIDSYLLGNISDEVKKQIDGQRKEDLYLENLLAFRGEGIYQLEGAFTEELKNSISGIERGLESEGFFAKGKQERRFGAVIQFTSRNRLSLAIAVSVVIAFGVFFIFRPGGTYSDLFDTYYSWQKPYLDENLENSKALGLITENADMLQNRAPFLQALDEGNYSMANTLITAHIDEWPDDQIARYYAGISLIELKHFKKAADSFEMLPSGFAYKSDADWYLALCYLRIKGKCELSVEILNRLADDPASAYREASKALLTKITC